jgi:Glyoxalase/Bleomycin resistance protein/Dioxygenase superfamily
MIRSVRHVDLVAYSSPPHRPGDSYGWLGLRAAQSGGHAVPYDLYAVGVHHVAFAASREEDDAAAERARTLAAEIASGPEEYGYVPRVPRRLPPRPRTGSGERRPRRPGTVRAARA